MKLLFKLGKIRQNYSKLLKITQNYSDLCGVWIEPAKNCALITGLVSSSARPAAALRDKPKLLNPWFLARLAIAPARACMQA